MSITPPCSGLISGAIASSFQQLLRNYYSLDGPEKAIADNSVAWNL
jgi:hypothetical protein